MFELTFDKDSQKFNLSFTSQDILQSMLGKVADKGKDKDEVDYDPATGITSTGECGLDIFKDFIKKGDTLKGISVMDLNSKGELVPIKDKKKLEEILGFPLPPNFVMEDPDDVMKFIKNKQKKKDKDKGNDDIWGLMS